MTFINRRARLLQIALLVVILLAVFLRFFHLSTIPASLSQDETTIGYNSYALLTTGHDEHGHFLPLSIQTFGNWTLPGYFFLSTIPIAIFGLNEFSVRVVSALAGSISVALIFFIAQFIFKKRLISFFSVLFFAISPWSIYFSRIAYEVNLATAFFLAGFALFLFWIEKKKKGLIILSSLFFGLTIFTYYSFVLFTPLFLVILLFFYRKQLALSREFKLSVILFVLLSAISIFNTFGGSAGELSREGITNNAVVYKRSDIFRVDHALSGSVIPFEKLLHNKFSAVGYEFLQNYINTYSPNFLFDQGGEKLLNTMGYFGPLYLIDALFLAVGLFSMIWRRDRNIKFILCWLIIAPISSAITLDAPSSTRLFLILPIFILLIAYGANSIVQMSKFGIFLKLIAFGVGILYLINFIYFADLYYFHLNYQRSRFLHYGFKQAVEISNKYPNYKVVMNGPDNFPYISFLFYNKYDPQKFREQVKYYPIDNNGFKNVKSFDRYNFVYKLNYYKLDPNILYISGDKPYGFKNGDTIISHGNGYRVELQTINLPSNEPIMWYYTLQSL